MLHKLTALALALLIASPVCWCGWMHGVKVAEATPSCCHNREAPVHDEAPRPGSEDCPCSKAPKAREAAGTKVFVPIASSYDGGPPVEIVHITSIDDASWSLIGSLALDASRLRRYEVPLRVRHCSWLI